MKMKTLGMIGGIGPESTIEYYRHLIAAYRAQKPDGSYPAIVINSINMKTLLDMIEADDRVKMVEFLVARNSKAGQRRGTVWSAGRQYAAYCFRRSEPEIADSAGEHRRGNVRKSQGPRD